MAHKLTIPLTGDFYDEVDDAFIDKPISAQRFIFGLVKNMCKDAKAGKLNKTCSYNIIENGKLKQDFIKLKEVDLAKYKLVSDPNWLPKDFEKDDVKVWEHSVTDKTMEYVELYCQMVGLRFQKYNESVEKSANEKIDKLKEEIDSAPEEKKDTLQRILDEEVENAKKVKEKSVEEIPKCIEQCVYNQIYPQLHQEVMKNMDVEFDKEFEESYPDEKKNKPKPATPPPR